MAAVVAAAYVAAITVARARARAKSTQPDACGKESYGLGPQAA